DQHFESWAIDEFGRGDDALFEVERLEETAHDVGRRRGHDAGFGRLRQKHGGQQNRRQDTGCSHLEPARCNSGSSATRVASATEMAPSVRFRNRMSGFKTSWWLVSGAATGPTPRTSRGTPPR